MLGHMCTYRNLSVLSTAVRTVMRTLFAISWTAAVAATLSSWTAQASDILQQNLWGLSSGLAYYVEVNIGQPLYSGDSSTSSNSFNLLLDTGSANTAVVTAQCCSLTNENLYSCSASSSCVDESSSISVIYISGSWSGSVVRDTFSGQGLGVVENMPFAEITSEDGFISSGYDGIIGMGYESIASPSNDPWTPYFDMVKDVDDLDDIFSLQLCGALQALSLSNVSLETDAYRYAGELLMGGLEGPNGENYYEGEIVYTPLVQERFYNVIVTDIGVNGQSLGVDCETINSPRSIVDSGSSNLAFPSSVYNAVVAELKSQVAQVTSVSDSFFSDDSTCCSDECNPSNHDSFIYQLPGLTIALALESDKSQQVTVTVPAEYIWRPIVLSEGLGEATCRVFGISEGSFTLLGDVFMDGLFTVHDRAYKRVGIAVADNCPNNVTSSKTITVEAIPSEDSYCNCVGSSDRSGSLLSSYWPFSSKPCFFWLWWMYVVIVAFVVILAMAVIYGYLCWKRRKLIRRLEALQSQNQVQPQRSLYPDECVDPSLLYTPTHSSSDYIEGAFRPVQVTTGAISNGEPVHMERTLPLSPTARATTESGATTAHTRTV